MTEPATTREHFAWSKVPHVTLAFWIVEIFATTVGETGGDALSMTLNLGYVISTLIFLVFFAVTPVTTSSSRTLSTSAPYR